MTTMTKKIHVSKKDKETMQMFADFMNGICFSEESVKVDPEIVFLGYIEQGYGISYTTMTDLDLSKKQVRFKERNGDLGIIEFRHAPGRYVFVGRDHESELFQPVFRASINKSQMDLNSVLVTGDCMDLYVEGYTEPMRFFLRK